MNARGVKRAILLIGCKKRQLSAFLESVEAGAQTQFPDTETTHLQKIACVLGRPLSSNRVEDFHEK